LLIYFQILDGPGSGTKIKLKEETIMKNLPRIIILSIALVFTATLFAVAFADNEPGFGRKGFGKHHMHRGSALSLLTRYQVKNLAAQTLSELSGQPVEVINLKFSHERPRDVMQELNIEKEAFQSSMHAKITNLVKQAEENGSITPEQEREILAKIEERVQRRALMKKLIDKGIADGSITEAQAQILQPKRR
jgi:hypothetical protein